MVFNATFNNISVISWRSVLLVEETGVSGENYSKITRFSTKLEMRCDDVLPTHYNVATVKVVMIPAYNILGYLITT
jgi:hypothetical protein